MEPCCFSELIASNIQPTFFNSDILQSSIFIDRQMDKECEHQRPSEHTRLSSTYNTSDKSLMDIDCTSHTMRNQTM